MSRVIIYIILIFLLSLLIVVDQFCPSLWGPFEVYSSGLVTEVIGIIITFALVDSLIQFWESRKDKKYKKQAMKLLARCFWNIGIRVSEAVKASLDELPSVLPSDVSSILSSNFAKELEHLDFIKNAPVVPSDAWVNRLKKEFTKSFEQVNSTLTTYLQYLDVDLVEKIRILETSTLISFPSTAIGMISQTQSDYDAFPIYRGNSDKIVADMKLLAEVIKTIQKEKIDDTLNGLLPGFWDPNYGAKLGSARTDYSSGRIFEGVTIL